eukprot:CAMPEP_0197623226 /NCGR_PEP_ID=MMETSP1338-20131121/3280_1 /TAXON_ID=43686 ORGANISM="Pelagodinium beii, Strain RCC1491" /NCGR_SAMPLE_ID=MMETSP1338 /ASSEMBLY_ACC=CAM_ASM_000754 /LENGTH=82 /DNA_ID=CAMNT_0043193131 /DNA_START=81 /DNA_END=326 /DNA_ORIENTATION=-
MGCMNSKTAASAPAKGEKKVEVEVTGLADPPKEPEVKDAEQVKDAEKVENLDAEKVENLDAADTDVIIQDGAAENKCNISCW